MTEGPYYETPKIKSPRHTKRKANDTDTEHIGAVLVGVLKESLSRNEDDPDRRFLLSLLNDFKRVPEHLKARTKMNIMKVIMEASYQPKLPPQNYPPNSHPSTSRNPYYENMTDITSPESQISDHSQPSDYYKLFTTRNNLNSY